MGQRNAPLSIEAVLTANGFGRIYHTDPLDKDASVVAVKAALAFDGPSAVLFQSPCVQLKKASAPVIVNAERCTGCKKCISEIGCPAISFDANATGMRSGDRGQACVSADLCNGCGLCVQICPFKAIATLSTSETVAFPPVKGNTAHERTEKPNIFSKNESRETGGRSSEEPLPMDSFALEQKSQARGGQDA